MPEPRAPQDHKPKQQKVADKPQGWELLKSPDEVPGWDQAEFLAVVQPLSESSDKNGDVVFSAAVLRVVAEVGVLVYERFAVDPEGFHALTSGGMPGLTRMINLCFWYAELLGKSEDSATS